MKRLYLVWYNRTLYSNVKRAGIFCGR